MELKEFVGKVVFSPKTGRRYVLKEITAAEICVATVEPGSSGYPSYYCYETINADPLSEGLLVFEDDSLLAPFRTAYQAYSQTEDARWERYGYYLNKE